MTSTTYSNEDYDNWRIEMDYRRNNPIVGGGASENDDLDFVRCTGGEIYYSGERDINKHNDNKLPIHKLNRRLIHKLPIYKLNKHNGDKLPIRRVCGINKHNGNKLPIQRMQGRKLHRMVIK